MNVWWNHVCTIDMYWNCIFHQQISSFMLWFFRNIVEYTIYRSLRSQLSPHMMKMCDQYDFLFYHNLTLWTRISLSMIGYFSHVNMTSSKRKKNKLMGTKANVSEFSSTNIMQQNTIPWKKLHLMRYFSRFLIIRKSFVKHISILLSYD